MKERIAEDYVQKVKHNFGNVAELPMAHQRSALVVGTDNHGSIGRAVVQALSTGMKNVYAPGKHEFNVLSPATMTNWLWQKDDLDTLILCHGYTHLAWFEDQMNDDLRDQVEVNLLGTMFAIKAFVGRTLTERHIRKTIVCVGSMAHNHVLNASAAYCASKAGVAHLVRCLGHELTPKGYFIYGVHPGNVEGTPMAQATIQGIVEYRHLEHDAAREYWASGLLMPRFLRADDVATTIRNLVLHDNGYQSGTNIELSGGQR